MGWLGVAGVLCVAVGAKEGVLFDVGFEGEWDGMGKSEVIARRVSAATMPPMECPTRIVWTEGSMVGEGVEAATSRSMTLFWSLFYQNRLRYHEECSRECRYHSRKRPTHSFKSPLVSNLG